MNIQTLREKLSEINREIGTVLQDCGYLDTKNLASVEWDERNPEDVMLHEEISGLLKHLDFVHTVLNYLQKPVIREGVICTNAEGRYELDGVELGERDIFEILRSDEAGETCEWALILFGGKGDYEGKTARIRG